MVEEFAISSLLEKGIEILGKGDYFNPLLDAQILLSHLLRVDRMYLYIHKDETVREDIAEEYFRLIELRKRRYPLQYIVGTQEFMSLDFKVGEGVLVPRPDTEVLVEKLIEIVDDGYFGDKKDIKIADIGTGSGAIALSLAHFIEEASVYSVDISPDALAIAIENAKILLLEERVQFLKGDLLEPLYRAGLEKKIDILVSNPPYIPSKVIEALQTEVSTYEPKLALDGGVDGLDFYRRIVDASTGILSEHGIIAFEIGHDQGESVKDLLVKNGEFEDIELISDLSGHDRVLIGKKG